jgi:hypothetical protein
VLEDCCVDMDAELHATLVSKVFARRAAVARAADFVETLCG